MNAMLKEAPKVKRYPASETIRLIEQHMPEAGKRSLDGIASVVKEHRLDEWQVKMKPGDYAADIFWCEDGCDPMVAYYEVVADENPRTDMNEVLSFSVKVYDDHILNGDPPEDRFPWDFHVKLTTEQFEFLRARGFPKRVADFVGAMIEHATGQ